MDSERTPKRTSDGKRYEFSNDWFAVHEPHWVQHLIPWAKDRAPLHILEIGSYEGRSSCWFLDHLLDHPESRLTCADLWQQASGDRLYPDDIDAVFARFQRNCQASGRASQVTTLRGDSKTTLRDLSAETFDLVYVDGDHSTEGVCSDSLTAIRLVKPGGMVLWDDYFWSESVKAGVDLACRAAGISVERLGENACFRKPETTPPASARGRIVGLVPARNEGARIEFCLRALAEYTDAIVYLDDCSTDDTLQRVERLSHECRVERILRKQEWLRDEPGDRNRLLQAGREIGGTHFVVLDADEAFTANFREQQLLRRVILSLQPGEQLAMAWIQLWRGFDFFRHDASVWTNNYKTVVFCDDGKCAYQSDFIHTPRTPANLAGSCHRIPGYDFGLLHFQFVNWRNLLLKQAWYRCLERIRDPKKSPEAINSLYAPSKDEAGLGLKSAPIRWLAYPAFDRAAITTADTWRESQVEGWFKEHGLERFRPLDIWDVDWPSTAVAPIKGSRSPRISVIVSTYNGERFLRGCLDDLEAQTVAGELEIIVVDSGSPQNEKDIVAEYQKRYKNILYVRTERETIYAAWNRAIGLAHGAVLTNANVDDRHAPDALEKMAAVFDLRPDVDLVYANCAVTKIENGVLGRDPLHGFFRWPPFDRRLLFLVCFIGPQPMWRRSLHDRFGLFDPAYTSAGDYEFWLRISSGARFFHCPDTLGLYLDHAASVEHAAPVVSQRESEEARKKHWPREWGRRPPRAGSFFQFAAAAELRVTQGRQTSPLVSVIIPTCARPATLRDAVQSVVNQTFQDFEIIVVNDAGPDVSDILDNFRQPVKIIQLRQEQKRERSAARNYGLSVAAGKYITYLDDDDQFYPEHLESLVAVLQSTGRKVAYTDASCAHQSDGNGGFQTIRREPHHSVDFSQSRLLVSNFIPILCLMHEKRCLDAAGVFDEGLNSHEDWEFWIRLSRHFEFVHLKKITCEFRVHNDTGPGGRLRYQEFLRTAKIIHDRYRMYVGQDREVARQQREFIASIQEKCKPLPSDGMKWVKFRVARPFQNLKRSLRKRLNRAGSAAGRNNE